MVSSTASQDLGQGLVGSRNLASQRRHLLLIVGLSLTQRSSDATIQLRFKHSGQGLHLAI